MQSHLKCWQQCSLKRISVSEMDKWLNSPPWVLVIKCILKTWRIIEGFKFIVRILFIPSSSFVLLLMAHLTLLFNFSYAGPDVHLLDPPEHVPDPEVPGNYWRCDFPCWEPHAGPESSEEVCPPMVSGTNGSSRVLIPWEKACSLSDDRDLRPLSSS